MQFSLNKKRYNTNNKLLVYKSLVNNLEISYPNKIDYNSIIPLKIFQTWHTKILPPKMLETVNLIKRLNPRFEHYLYDDNDCREFIQENFSEDVLNAYDSLVPGAYKADLWRYCILYKQGGIYIDLSYIPYNGFKFINLTEKEHFVLDLPSCNTGVSGIYNALMVCLAGNEKLLKAINKIVENVSNNYYGNCWLEPTGPLLLEKYFSKFEKNKLELKHEFNSSSQDGKIIKLNSYIILKGYNEYKKERDIYSIKKHYGDLWKEKKIYKMPDEIDGELIGLNINDNTLLTLKEYNYKIYSLPYTFLKSDYNPIIPLNIYQTWHTKNLPPKMRDTVELLKKQNPRFQHFLYDDNDCREFIKQNFSRDILNAYDSLVPGAYKADLWRLCILYINGGIYIDIKFSCVNGFELIELTENEHFVLDRRDFFSTPNPIYNAFMVCKKTNPFLLLAINKIVKNVKNKYYGPSPLYPTGPGMFSELLLDKNLNINIDLFHHEDNKYLIYKNRFVISVIYPEYTLEREKSYNSIKQKFYGVFWNEKKIYY